ADHLERDFVDVNRMRVGGSVVELPHLGSANSRILCDGIHPQSLRPYPWRTVRISSHGAEQSFRRGIGEESGGLLEQRKRPGDGFLRQPCNLRQLQEHRRGGRVTRERMDDTKLDHLARGRGGGGGEV